jgi:hypothetical protein
VRWNCPAGYSIVGFEICHWRAALDPEGYPCHRVCDESWRDRITPEMLVLCGQCQVVLVLDHFDTCPLCGERVRKGER